MNYTALIVAMVLALVGGFVFLRVIGDGGSPKGQGQVLVQTTQPDYKTVDVLVASKRITIGEVITADMLDTQPWPDHLVVSGFVTSGEKSRKLVGMVSRARFQQGEPVMLSKLANPDDPGFLAAGLPEGRRAITISTDGVAGLAGFLNPGDRVDIMVTHPIPEIVESEKNKEQTVTETLLKNVKVLAVDQYATAGDNAEANSKKVKLPSSVSLEVSLEEAQKVRLAQDVGYVSLALRSLESDKEDEVVDVTYQKDLSKSPVYADIEEIEKNKNKDTIKIIRGIEAEEIKVKSDIDDFDGSDSD